MRFAGWLVFVCFMLASATSGATNRTAALSAGEIFVDTIPVKDAYYPRVRVQGVIDAPPTAVWHIVSDCVGSARYNRSVTKSYIVKRIGKDVVCSETVDLPWPIRDVECVTRWSFRPKAREIHWTLAGGDFDYATGRWKLEPFGDGSRTLLIYENHVSPQISVPNWLKRMFLDIGLPGLIKDVRRAI